MKSKVYKLVTDDDNSLKQLFDRFYVIPKDYKIITDSDREMLEKYRVSLINQLVSEGKNGYIVFRGRKPKKLTPEQIAEIKADSTSTLRQLAFKYGCSHGTIGKIKNGKY